MYCGWFSLNLSWLRFALLFKIINLCILPNFRSFSHLKKNFLALASFLFSGTPVTQTKTFWYCSTGPEAQFMFCYIFPSLFSGPNDSYWFIFSFLTLTLVIFILPSRHPVVFNFRYCIFMLPISAENFYFPIQVY